MAATAQSRGLWTWSYTRPVGTELSGFANLRGLLRLFLRTILGRLHFTAENWDRRSYKHGPAAGWGRDSTQEVTQHPHGGALDPRTKPGRPMAFTGHNAPKS